MSKPRYTAVESQLTISPPYRSASARPSALLPVAVGPRIATARGLDDTGQLQRASADSATKDTTDANALSQPQEHVDDEDEQDDQETELLGASHQFTIDNSQFSEFTIC